MYDIYYGFTENILTNKIYVTITTVNRQYTLFLGTLICKNVYKY